MIHVSPVIALLGTVIGLAAAGGIAWAVLKASYSDKLLERMTLDRNDLLGRWERSEKEKDALARENELLKSLHNPAQQIADLAEQEQQNHEVTFGVLRDMSGSLDHIDQQITRRLP